jgi:hypothetical protein
MHAVQVDELVGHDTHLASLQPTKIESVSFALAKLASRADPRSACRMNFILSL